MMKLDSVLPHIDILITATGTCMYVCMYVLGSPVSPIKNVHMFWL